MPGLQKQIVVLTTEWLLWLQTGYITHIDGWTEEWKQAAQTAYS